MFRYLPTVTDFASGYLRESNQQAGPNDTTYKTGRLASVASAHFAHRSRRLMTRTASQTARAREATSRAKSREPPFPDLSPSEFTGMHTFLHTCRTGHFRAAGQTHD